MGAVVAQLAEQLIRNEQVAGSIPVNGSIFYCLISDGIDQAEVSKLLTFSFGITATKYQKAISSVPISGDVVLISKLTVLLSKFTASRVCLMLPEFATRTSINKSLFSRYSALAANWLEYKE